MSTRLTFWGSTGFEVVTPTKRILIDPFLLGNPVAPIQPDDVEPPDLILISHMAFEYPGDVVALAKRTGAPVVCGPDVRVRLLDEGVEGDQIRATGWGVRTEVAGIVVLPVESRRWSISSLANGQLVTGIPLAFIIETEPGVRVYYYGETSYFDMRWVAELYAPTVAILGCSQTWELLDEIPGPGRLVTGELSPDEAARIAEMLGVQVAVACHYLTHNEDVESFLALVQEYDSTGKRRAVAPKAGETIVVDASGLSS